MFFWPHLELSDYEKRFVAAYGTPEIKADPKKGIKGSPAKAGVLRRIYRVILNNTVHAAVSELQNIHLEGQVQISRASRVFALTFSGDVHAWRLKISTASGTEFTPKLTGGTYPMVSTLSPGASWNFSATNIKQPGNLTINAIATRQIAWQQLPFIIDPNWELDPNESLLFNGEAQDASALILEIGVHVWEFPGMIRGMEGPDQSAIPRSGGGPSFTNEGNC